MKRLVFLSLLILFSGCVTKPKIVIFDSRPTPGEWIEFLQNKLETMPTK